MCRHLAYVGPSASLRDVLCDPPFALFRQAWAPRRQRHGTVNADGFGVGWYAGDDPIPARYRRAVPMWADPSFLDLARVTRTTALLAAVRSATAGTAPDESAAAPYRRGRWLFSHNGLIEGWPASMAGPAGGLPADLLLDQEARTDSALLWALVLHRLAAGDAPGQALAGAVGDVAACAGGRFNLLLTDGATIAATAAGDTLSYRLAGAAVVVASEPDDDDAGWVDVPDGSVLVAAAGQVTVSPLPTADHATTATA
jgi:glutamine amidotransferase